MAILIPYVCIVMKVINIALHSTGIYLLRCLLKIKQESIQNVILLNLSACELLMNFLEGIRNLLMILIDKEIHVKENNIVKEYLQILMLICFVFYLVMFHLTLDRLLHVTYPFKYRIYCTRQSVKVVLTLIWVVSVCITIALVIAYHFECVQPLPFVFTYIFPIIGFLFIGLAIITYVSIYRKVMESRKFQNSNKSENWRQNFQRSKFIPPVLLIMTFIVFMVVPDLTILFVGIIGDNMSDYLISICEISYGLSNMADACIYIFMKPDVRKLFLRKVNS